MGYIIKGVSHELVHQYAGLNDAELAKHNARRITADAKPGYPCRATLEDADIGDTLILFHHVSHDVTSPYRSSYAIFIRENAAVTAEYQNTLPPVFKGRHLALRGFDAQAMLNTAVLALPGEAEAKIKSLFEDDAIAYIDVHNAAHGCFAARVEPLAD